MITISLEVDHVTDIAYQNLSHEHKERLNEDICMIVKNTVSNVRSARIKKIVEEIAKGAEGMELNAEILTTLLQEED